MLRSFLTAALAFQLLPHANACRAEVAGAPENFECLRAHPRHRGGHAAGCRGAAAGGTQVVRPPGRLRGGAPVLSGVLPALLFTVVRGMVSVLVRRRLVR